MICAAVSQHTSTEGICAPASYLSLLLVGASMTGMLVLRVDSDG